MFLTGGLSSAADRTAHSRIMTEDMIPHMPNHELVRGQNTTPRRFQRRTSHRATVLIAQVLSDLCALAMAGVTAGFLAWLVDTTLLHVSFRAFVSNDLQQRILVWSCLSAALAAWFGMTGTYTTRRPLQEDIKHTISALFVVLMIDGFLEFASKGQFSRLWILLVWPVAAVLVPISRIVTRGVLDWIGIWRIGAAVLGNGEHYVSVEHSLMKDTYVGYYVAYHSKLATDAKSSLSAVATKLAADMRLRGAEIAIMVPNDKEMGQVGRIVDALNLNLTPYVLIPPIQRLPFSGLTIQTIYNSDAIMMTSRNGLMSPVRQAVKRLFDIVIGSVALIMLAPLFIVLSALIMFSGGSPFYGHERIGHSGRPFRCLKFRSMAKNADKLLADLIARDSEAAAQWRQNFKLKNDPRITSIGRFLRKTSLDELPQLINVLRGDMSLVGPRPVIAEELKRYYGEDAFYYRLVRPGITGLWQVSGRSRTSYERRVFLDSWYVRNWSLWTDLVILFNTVPSVILRDGAH